MYSYVSLPPFFMEQNAINGHVPKLLCRVMLVYHHFLGKKHAINGSVPKLFSHHQREKLAECPVLTATEPRNHGLD